MKMIYIEYTAWSIADLHGNRCSGVVTESYDAVHVCGLLSFEGNDLYFEAEFHHLITFANHNKLNYVTENKIVELEIPECKHGKPIGWLEPESIPDDLLALADTADAEGGSKPARGEPCPTCGFRVTHIDSPRFDLPDDAEGGSDAQD